MSTPLTPKIEQLISERLKSGSYKSAIAVIEDAFEALTEREKFQAVRAELDHADEQLERGEYAEYDESTTQGLARQVKTRGRIYLVEERKRGTR